MKNNLVKHKLRVYIDTSVIGGCYDVEFEKWSIKLIEEFKKGEKIAVISDITLEELEEAPEKVRKILDLIPEIYKENLLLSKEVKDLAYLYIKEGAITKKFEEDALHIAIATINKIDILASWNFKHIVNIKRIKLYNAVNLKNGYQILEIRNPREVINESI
ncbi:PIN domain protein [bacterium]|nr:PIN domain protein [bacterium]